MRGARSERTEVILGVNELPNRFTNAARALFGRKFDDPLSILLDMMGARRQSTSGKTVNLQTAVSVAAAFACGRVISEGIATQPAQILQKSVNTNTGKGVANVTIIEDVKNPLTRLLSGKPNPMQSPFEFQEMVALHAVFCGTAYVWTPRVHGKIDALYPLKPNWVKQTYTWPKPPYYDVTTDDGQTFRLQQEEVWPIRGPAWDMYLGFEFIKIARDALGLAMAIEEGQGRSHQRGVKPSGYIAVDGVLNKEQQTKMMEWLEREYAGAENSGRPMVLDRAAKWVQQAMSGVEAQTLETRSFQIEEVCRFMRVMPIMVGVSNKGATYASSEQLFLAHLVHTLTPWTRRFESSGTAWLLSDADRAAGKYMKYDDRALHRMTAVDTMNYLTKGTNSGVLVRNEARRELDYNPIEGLDEPLTPVNVVAGEPPTVESNQQQPQPTGGF